MSANVYQDYLASTRKKEKPRYEGYTGNKVWRVTHPKHGMIEVVAPSKQAAIAAAASAWGVAWHKYDFYEYCEVSSCGTEKNRKETPR